MVSLRGQRAVLRIAATPAKSKVDSATVDRLRHENRGGQVLTTSYSQFDPARLWNATSGDCVYTFFHPGGWQLHAPSFSPNRMHVVFTCGDAAKLWNSITAAHLRTFESHTGPIASIAFSPDGTKLLASAKDDTTKIWDAVSGTCLQKLSHNGKQVELDCRWHIHVASCADKWAVWNV